MFYQTDGPHGLPHNPFNALVLPRPIGWISSVGKGGHVNLAPYSFFNAVAYTPPQVMFAATGAHDHGGLKDSVRNIEETGEFVVNVATWELRRPMNASSTPAPSEIDEFEVAGLTPEPAVLVKPPRVAESPAHLECVHTKTVHALSDDPDNPNVIVLGRVVGVYIADHILTDGLVDYAKLQPVGRLGYRDYVRVTDVFSMDRPGWP